ncbi:hypothetical protein PZA11_001347 [Diplocarpon coronariae]
MEYMIRFTQTHEKFRLAEINALAVLEGISLELLSYSPSLSSTDAAIRLVRRSILAKSVYEVWGSGSTYEDLHDNVRATSQHLWPVYKQSSFKFTIDSFQGSRSMTEQRKLIEGFKFIGLEGPIRMKGAEQEFCISEDFNSDATALGIPQPQSVHLGRYLGGSDRDAILKYDLKKRKYICTTSMDAELSLVTANITLAAPGKLFYDPFVGSGSFPVACAHFGALAFGSDIDGRSIRGKGKVSLYSNFIQYGIADHFGDSFVADLTNTPLRTARIFDGIVCDPPYGVREGLKVLGSRDPTKGKEESYIPPKRPYGFLAMLDDILEFASQTLVENGRLSFWMPTSNDQDQEIKVPEHPCLEIISICTQVFNRWSRRLITYRRVPDSEVVEGPAREQRVKESGVNADDLNPFRKGYFKGFKTAFR